MKTKSVVWYESYWMTKSLSSEEIEDAIDKYFLNLNNKAEILELQGQWNVAIHCYQRCLASVGSTLPILTFAKTKLHLGWLLQ